MPLLKRLQRVDRDIEKRVVTGIIISDKVLNKLIPFLDADVLELGMTKEIVGWVIDYHAKYKKAPREHIRDLFLASKQSLRPEIAEDVEQFLATLSEEFVKETETTGINEDFIIDRSLQYLKERLLRKNIEQVTALLDAGKIDEAEKLAEENKKILRKADYRWVSPLDDMKYLNSVFDEKENPLLTFKSKLGEMLGPMYRTWLMGVMAPFKRGKSFFLQDLAFDSILCGLRVVFCSLEMSGEHQSKRLYSQISQHGEEDKEYLVPCFDCCSNQDNSCTKKIRTCKEKAPGQFKPNLTYKPCTACRNNPKEVDDFLAGSWFVIEKRTGLTRKNIRKEIGSLQKMVGHKLFKLISYPAFSATLSDFEEDLEELEVNEGFIPDVIIIDYADILQPETKQKDTRHQIDEIWKRLKGMAHSRSTLVISASQSNRGSTTKEVLSEQDIAEEARKLAHADIWIALNQTSEEKDNGVWRIGVLEHRWRKFSKYRQVMALQQFEIGQSMIDQEIIHYNN